MIKKDNLLRFAHLASATCEVAMRAVSLVDLTSLNDDDTQEFIAALCQPGKHTCRAGRCCLCVPPVCGSGCNGALR